MGGDDDGDDGGDDGGYGGDDGGNDDGDDGDDGGDDGGQRVANDDDYYNYIGDDRRQLSRLTGFKGIVEPAFGQLELYTSSFMKEVESHRELGDVYDWNMCKQLFKYGMWCDEDCRDLDTFRVDEWSNSDVFLLVIMCVFMASMMLLVFAKRVKAYEKASVYGDEIETPYPGLPPVAMVLVFAVIMTVILILAHLKFVNETLVFSVVTCILLFIYMLKLTLFENRGNHLLPASRQNNARQNAQINSMNRRLFD